MLYNKNMMNTVEAAKKSGLTYRQVRYLFDRGIIKAAPVKQGEDRQISDGDFRIIELAAALRNKGIGFTRVHPALLASVAVNLKLNFLYANDEGNKPFAVYWDGSTWEVEKTIEGMSKLYAKAVSSKNSIFYGGFKKIEEAQNEQPKRPGD